MSRPQRSIPLYKEIQNHILQLIEAGELKPQDQIPPDSELATKFQTTRATVAHALQTLVFQGIVTRRIGKGTFVASSTIMAPFEPTRVRSFEEQMAEEGASIEYVLLKFERKTCEEESSLLNVEQGKEIYRLERLRLKDQEPLSIERRLFPIEIGQKMTVDSLNRMPFLTIIEREVKLKIREIRGSIRAATAPGDVAKIMKISQGAPLLIRNFILFGCEGTAISYNESIYKDNFHVNYIMRASDET